MEYLRARAAAHRFELMLALGELSDPLAPIRRAVSIAWIASWLRRRFRRKGEAAGAPPQARDADH